MSPPPPTLTQGSKGVESSSKIQVLLDAIVAGATIAMNSEPAPSGSPSLSSDSLSNRRFPVMVSPTVNTYRSSISEASSTSPIQSSLIRLSEPTSQVRASGSIDPASATVIVSLTSASSTQSVQTKFPSRLISTEPAPKLIKSIVSTEAVLTSICKSSVVSSA